MLVKDERVARALVWILFKQLAHQFVEFERQVRHVFLRTVELPIAMLVQEFDVAGAGEGGTACEEDVKDATEAVEVAAFADDFPGRLFGGKELGGADDAVGRGQVGGGEDFGDAEIGELDLPLSVED